MPDSPDGPSKEDEALDRAKADIEMAKFYMEHADIEEVDEPSGRKHVEIAWEDEDGFHEMSGEAVGVYRERKTIYHIDWVDGDRTTVSEDAIVTFDEGDYRIEK